MAKRQTSINALAICATALLSGTGVCMAQSTPPKATVQPAKIMAPAPLQKVTPASATVAKAKPISKPAIATAPINKPATIANPPLEKIKPQQPQAMTSSAPQVKTAPVQPKAQSTGVK